jgi:dTDP-4-amino-4,6-dideoxygalactose transaminase
MVTLREIADRHNLKLIVDSCEAHGCMYNSHFMSAFGDFVTYSFYTAHLIVAGEGGAVCSMLPEYNDIIKSVRSHGREPDSLYFDHVRFGLNLKPNDMEAAVGLEGLDTFWETFHTRKKHYYVFWEVCEPYLDKIYISQESRNCDNSPHAFSITLKEYDKDKFQKLTSVFDYYKIHWKRNFGSMPTQHKCFDYLGYKLGDFPNSEHIGDMGLHFTLSQYLSTSDKNRIIDCLEQGLKIL